MVVFLVIFMDFAFAFSPFEDPPDVLMEPVPEEPDTDFGPLSWSSLGNNFLDAQSSRTIEKQYGNLFDPVTAAYFLLMQLYHAQVDATFPTVQGPLRFRPASDGFFELRPCKRTDLAKCLYYGTLLRCTFAGIEGIAPVKLTELIANDCLAINGRNF